MSYANPGSSRERSGGREDLKDAEDGPGMALATLGMALRRPAQGADPAVNRAWSLQGLADDRKSGGRSVDDRRSGAMTEMRRYISGCPA